MSNSTNRQLSYTALKEIVPLLPFTTRCNLGGRSDWIQSLCLEPPIKSIKFFQPYGEYTIPAENFNASVLTENFFAPQYSARLTVDSATWHFDYDDLSQQVKVTCSLYPGREILSSDKTLAKWFFTFFMQFGVVQLELEECANPFEYITPLHRRQDDSEQRAGNYYETDTDSDSDDYHGPVATIVDGREIIYEPPIPILKCSRLRWKINRVFLSSWTRGIRGHVFDELHIVDVGQSAEVAEAANNMDTKHIIWTDEDYCSGGTRNFVSAIGLQSDDRVNHIRLRVVDRYRAFGYFSELMKEDDWETGSFVELLYEKNAENKRRVWRYLSQQVPGSRVVVLHDREISVLEVTEDYVLYAELFKEDELRFKMSKVARENCELDLEALRDPE